MKSTPEKILDAASAEFEAHGFDGCRLEHVAKRAGVNKALVYRHFGGKEQLYRETLCQEIQQRREFIGRLPDSLADMLVAWSRRQREDTQFIRLIGREGLRDDGGTPLEAESRKAYYAEQIEMLRSMQTAGELREDIDPEVLFFALLVLTVGPVLLPQIMRLAVPGEDRDLRWETFLAKLAELFEPDE